MIIFEVIVPLNVFRKCR